MRLDGALNQGIEWYALWHWTLGSSILHYRCVVCLTLLRGEDYVQLRLFVSDFSRLEGKRCAGPQPDGERGGGPQRDPVYAHALMTIAVCCNAYAND